MPKTYEPIATTSLPSGGASITFSSIPQTYTDLVLTTSGLAQTGGGGSIALKFNNDTLASSTNYSYIYMRRMF